METNHDELEDRVGGLFRSSADLVIDLNNQNSLLIEGLDDIPNRTDKEECKDDEININNMLQTIPETTGVIQTLTNNDTISRENTDENGDQEVTPEVWRPPTPPKVSPLQNIERNEIIPNGLNYVSEDKSVEYIRKSPSKTPSPPQLSSIDISHWRNNEQSKNENTCQNAKTLAQPEETRFDACNGLNETFDLPFDANIVSRDLNPNIREHMDTADVETTVILTSIRPCSTERKNDLSLTPRNIQSPELKYTKLNVFDTTEIIEEPTIVTSCNDIPNADATPSQMTDTQEQHVFAIDTKESLITVENITNNTENNHKCGKVEKKLDIILDKPLSEFVNDMHTTPSSQAKANKKIVSDRRGTFTLYKTDAQSSAPNVAVVSPNTRREIKTNETQEIMLTNSIQSTENDQIPEHAIDVTNNQRLDMEAFSGLTTNTTKIDALAEQTPGKTTPLVVPSTAVESKRKLKRSGQTVSSCATSASTSKLLKGLSAYKPLAKAKVPAISSTPSYMAATSSSSRRLNFTNSGMSSEGNHKENRELKMDPVHSKDIAG